MVKMGKLVNLVLDDELDVSDRENLNLDSDEDKDSEITGSDDETYSRPFEFQSITEIRWNSEIKCLRRIMKIKLNDLNDALDQIDENRLRLDQTEFTNLTEIMKILEPFECVTNEIK
ncbi:hypothetical protein BpHYR1_020964, partial [Brachionus plicatilis]